MGVFHGPFQELKWEAPHCIRPKFRKKIREYPQNRWCFFVSHRAFATGAATGHLESGGGIGIRFRDVAIRGIDALAPLALSGTWHLEILAYFQRER